MNDRTHSIAGLEPDRLRRPPLHHVNIKTTRLQEMIDWYGVVTGCEVTFQYELGAWLSNDDAHHRIAFLSFPSFSDDPEKDLRTGLQHTAFELATFEDLMATYVRLREAGIVPSFCQDHGMTLSYYYLDPDGNALELQVDTFGDWRKSTEFMREALAFQEDPLGPWVDPEQIVDAHLAGLSFEEIHRGAYAGNYQPDPLPLVPGA